MFLLWWAYSDAYITLHNTKLFNWRISPGGGFGKYVLSIREKIVLWVRAYTI